MWKPWLPGWSLTKAGLQVWQLCLGGALVQQASRAGCLSSHEVTQSQGAAGLLSYDTQAPKSVNSNFESFLPWLGIGLEFHEIKHILTCLSPGWSSSGKREC